MTAPLALQRAQRSPADGCFSEPGSASAAAMMVLPVSVYPSPTTGWSVPSCAPTACRSKSSEKRTRGAACAPSVWKANVRKNAAEL